MFFHSRLDDWLQIIRGEFQEMPGVPVTLAQAEELWGLQRDDLELILNTFVDVGFLRRSADGAYVHRPVDDG